MLTNQRGLSIAATAVASIVLTSVTAASSGPAHAAAARPAAAPSLQRTVFHSPDPQPHGAFGDATAISGNTLAIGQPNAEPAPGAVYVYQKTSAQGWSQAKLVATLTIGDPASGGVAFGSRLTMSGNTIAVGAFAQTVGSNSNQGSVDVYTEPSGGWKSTSTPTAILSASTGAPFDQLGLGIAMDGNTIVAAAPNVSYGAKDAVGALFVFTRTGANWTSGTQTAELTEAVGTGEDFLGYALAMSGNTIVATAPDRSFGSTYDAGIAFLWNKPDAAAWVNAKQTRRLQSPDLASIQYFGQSVSVSGDDVLVGAPGVYNAGPHNVAYLFTKPAAGWGGGTGPLTTASRLDPGTSSNDGFGQDVFLSTTHAYVGETFAAVGGQTVAGAVQVFTKPSGGWHAAAPTATLTESPAVPNDEFGEPVTAAGSTVVASATDQGSTVGTVVVFAPPPPPQKPPPPPKPSLTKVTNSHHRWKLGHHAVQVNAAHHHAHGDVIAFHLSQKATVTMTFTKSRTGPDRKLGSLSFTARKGHNTVYIDGPLGHHHKLVSGKIIVHIRAKNSAKEHSATKTVSFHTHH